MSFGASAATQPLLIHYSTEAHDVPVEEKWSSTHTIRLLSHVTSRPLERCHVMLYTAAHPWPSALLERAASHNQSKWQVNRWIARLLYNSVKMLCRAVQSFRGEEGLPVHGHWNRNSFIALPACCEISRCLQRSCSSCAPLWCSCAPQMDRCWCGRTWRATCSFCRRGGWSNPPGRNMRD